MPINATQRPTYSDLVKGVMSFEEDTKTNFNFETVTVGGTATIGSIGVPVVWNTTNGRFEVYVAQTFGTSPAVGPSSLPDGAIAGILVGDKFGYGFNKADINLADGDVPMTILYRGDATITNDGMAWGSAAAPKQAAFLTQMQAQRITTIDTATVVTPSY